jgi:Holliday junction resolvase RusA-like endonuclease
MRRVVIFTLPFEWAASVNIRLRPGGSRLVLSDKYKNRKHAAHMIFLNARPRGVVPTTDQRWALFMDFWWPTRGGGRDADNYVKMIKDALEDVIYEDDAAVAYHDCWVRGAEGTGRIEIAAVPVRPDWVPLARTTDIR